MSLARSAARRCIHAVPPALAWLRRWQAKRAASQIDPAHKDANPVLVYQMGKVGSSTVARTLGACPSLHRPVLSVHFMVPSEIEAVKQYRRRIGGAARVSYFLMLGAAVGDRIAAVGDRVCLPVVSLVRDPIAREISSVFQSSALFGEALRDGDRIDTDRALAFLGERFSGPDPCGYAEEWFDRELAVTFGIDVFDQPFDRERGYTILRSRRADVLLLRTEDLDRTLPAAVAELLGLAEEPALLRDNERVHTPDSETYARVRESFRLPRSVVEGIYQGRLARHFYGKDMIEAFTRRWSAPAAEGPRAIAS